MRKLLLWILIPLLSGVFVTASQFEMLEEKVEDLEQEVEILEQRIDYLESLIKADELLTETFLLEGVHMSIELVVVDGLMTSMTVCDLIDDECEIEYPTEQERPFLNSDREALLIDLQKYLDLLERLYDNFGG